MYHRQDTIAMESARPHPERNPEWVKKQEKKIVKGIEDATTKEYQTDQRFEELWDAVENEGFEMRVNIGTDEKEEWITL